MPPCCGFGGHRSCPDSALGCHSQLCPCHAIVWPVASVMPASREVGPRLHWAQGRDAGQAGGPPPQMLMLHRAAWMPGFAQHPGLLLPHLHQTQRWSRAVGGGAGYDPPTPRSALPSINKGWSPCTASQSGAPPPPPRQEQLPCCPSRSLCNSPPAPGLIGSDPSSLRLQIPSRPVRRLIYLSAVTQAISSLPLINIAALNMKMNIVSPVPVAGGARPGE